MGSPICPALPPEQTKRGLSHPEADRDHPDVQDMCKRRNGYHLMCKIHTYNEFK